MHRKTISLFVFCYRHAALVSIPDLQVSHHVQDIVSHLSGMQVMQGILAEVLIVAGTFKIINAWSKIVTASLYLCHMGLSSLLHAIWGIYAVWCTYLTENMMPYMKLCKMTLHVQSRSVPRDWSLQISPTSCLQCGLLALYPYHAWLWHSLRAFMHHDSHACHVFI